MTEQLREPNEGIRRLLIISFVMVGIAVLLLLAALALSTRLSPGQGSPAVGTTPSARPSGQPVGQAGSGSKPGTRTLGSSGSSVGQATGDVEDEPASDVEDDNAAPTSNAVSGGSTVLPIPSIHLPVPTPQVFPTGLPLPRPSN